MKKKILLLMGGFSLGLLQAQVGINTQNPTAMLHITGVGNTLATKALEVVNSSSQEIFTVLDNGYVGLGVTDPTIALDLRANTDRDALGVGSTNQTAAAIGAGVLKYDPALALLFISDASIWLPLASSIEKSTVLAHLNNPAQVFNTGNTTTIIDWNVNLDNLNTFNTSTGVFTAPHDGLYSVSVMLGFNSVAVANNSTIAILLVGSNGITISGITTYPMGGTVDVYARCTGSFSLNQGQTIAMQVENFLGVSVTLGNSTFNKLSIIES